MFCKALRSFVSKRSFTSSPFPKIEESDISKLSQFKNLSLTTIVDALWILKYSNAQINGLNKFNHLNSNDLMIGYATTLNFVPFRQDIYNHYKGKNELSSEYIAFNNTLSHNIICIQSYGNYSSIGGDIKLSILKNNKIGGLITNGGIRDIKNVSNYGFPIYANSITSHQGPSSHIPWNYNNIITLNDTIICPNDLIIADNFNVIVVPYLVINKVLKLSNLRQLIEDIILTNIDNIQNINEKNNFVMKYYPFNNPIPKNSEIEKLIESKGMLEKIRDLENQIFE